MKGERTCIGCGRKAKKATMARIARDRSGAIYADLTGKDPGRGAYVCSPECLSKAKKDRRFAPALRTRINDGEFEAVAMHAMQRLAALDAEGKE